MKNTSLVMITIIAAILLSSCGGTTQGQSANNNLDAVAFAEKINELPGAPVLDVRTPGEFADGHLKNAINIDWNGNSFESEVSKISKEEPVFVYCLSGGRSHSAAEKMRSMGFKNVYELNGGIIKWRAANLPQEDVNTTGMTREAYDKLVSGDKKVLIDFYAEWCGPCKKMAPYLEAMKSEMADSVTIIRIDADKNQALAKALNVDALPTVMLYKGGAQVWRKTGFIDKPELVKEINSK
ncbi:MAG: hypothetical protein RLZZ367_1001 [Bacteroidota bacterium]|jgi:thioredoxin